MRIDITSSVTKHCPENASAHSGSHVLVMRDLTIGDSLTMHQLNHNRNGSGLMLWFAEQVDRYEVDGESRDLDQWFAMPNEVLQDSWKVYCDEALAMGEADADSSR